MQKNKRFRRVFLHVGLGKTGTSTIQSYLATNAVRIKRDYDIHFPHVFDLAGPFDGNHSQLLRTISRSEVEHSSTHTYFAGTKVNGMALGAEEVRSKFDSGFSDSKATQLLISAEAVGHFNARQLLLLSSWLCEYSDSVVVIACIRHPVAALSSEIQQRLRFGAVLEELYEKPPCYSFRELLPRLEAAFPGSEMLLYDFEDASGSSSGVVGTFLQKIGIEEDLRGDFSGRVNPSMSQHGAMLLSALNQARSSGSAACVDEGLTRGDVAPFLKIPGRKFQAVPRAYGRLERLVEKDLLWLEQEHGVNLTCRPIDTHAQGFIFSERWLARLAVGISACHVAFRRFRALGRLFSEKVSLRPLSSKK